MNNNVNKQLRDMNMTVKPFRQQLVAPPSAATTLRDYFNRHQSL